MYFWNVAIFLTDERVTTIPTGKHTAYARLDDNHLPVSANSGKRGIR